ncbi:MAG: hypothetical protein IT376_20340 [Polyangiaceae bacterium]|nr:hypothetical protein [Polyangiaceae bacterium]
MPLTRRAWLIALVALASAAPSPALAAPRGRPTIQLDRLDFPTDHPRWPAYKQHLRRSLAREAKRAVWGAGRGSTIQYRFEVSELSVVAVADDVLRVTCAATGRLPRGRSASSRLSFGGDPRRRDETVRRVLEIVARGVITRLAEIERVRRGELERRRVRAPSSDLAD